jgi:hypothetical protein
VTNSTTYKMRIQLLLTGTRTEVVRLQVIRQLHLIRHQPRPTNNDHT